MVICERFEVIMLPVNVRYDLESLATYSIDFLYIDFYGLAIRLNVLSETSLL